MLREEAVDEEEREEEGARQGRRPAPAAAPESQILAAAAAVAVGRAGGRGMFSCGVCAARGRGVGIEQVQGSADDDEAGSRKERRSETTAAGGQAHQDANPPSHTKPAGVEPCKL
jgi:hypothetical protein